jgi:hypothetical protein
MDMQVLDDPLGRDMKRVSFAKRLFSHQVRTGRITFFTGLSRNRLTTLRRHWGVPKETRRRGRSPWSAQKFLKDDARAEGAAVAAICRKFGVFEADASVMERGLRLCDAYEAYRACYPDATMEFEAVLLLMGELTHANLMQLGTCRRCRGAMLTARFEVTVRVCGHCEPAVTPTRSGRRRAAPSRRGASRPL